MCAKWSNGPPVISVALGVVIRGGDQTHDPQQADEHPDAAVKLRTSSRRNAGTAASPRGRRGRAARTNTRASSISTSTRQRVGRDQLEASATASASPAHNGAAPQIQGAPPRSSSPPRRCRASRSGRGRAAGCRRPSAVPRRPPTSGPPPAARTSANIPRIAIDPKIRLPIRQANGPSPNSSIAPAMISLATWGCSALGSVPSGESS